MEKIKIIRYVCGAVIVIGFFLPWMDMGEMGEMMSGFAAMAGGEFSSTFSALQLASGGEEIPGDSYPLLWVVPVFGLLAAIAKGRKQLFLGSIAAIIIILIGGPILQDGAQMMSSGMTTWAIGKILSIIGCAVLLITGFTDGSKTEANSP
jgi:hypothetical protein